jgi:hypothetical protein
MPGARYSHGRRRFVQLLGWASVIAAAPGGPALAQVAGKNRGKSSPAPVTPAPAPPDTGHAAAAEVSDEARALAEVVRRRYGEHLDAEDLTGIGRDLDGDLQAIKRLREVKLVNADEPDVTFRA